jgi:hypothetical protein
MIEPAIDPSTHAGSESKKSMLECKPYITEGEGA